MAPFLTTGSKTCVVTCTNYSSRYFTMAAFFIIIFSLLPVKMSASSPARILVDGGELSLSVINSLCCHLLITKEALGSGMQITLLTCAPGLRCRKRWMLARTFIRPKKIKTSSSPPRINWSPKTLKRSVT